jgi:hypothetical protein
MLILLVLQVVDSASPNSDTVIKIGKPGAASHIITLKPGEMYEIVIQNDRAGLYGGEYASGSPLTSARNGREQHSFHLHGACVTAAEPGYCCPGLLTISTYPSSLLPAVVFCLVVLILVLRPHRHAAVSMLVSQSPSAASRAV